MKNRLFKLSMFIFTVLAGLASCSKKDDPAPGGGNLVGEVTFTIDGDGYTNQTITIQAIVDSNNLSQGGLYFKKSNFTWCKAGSSSDTDPETGLPKNEFNFDFHGNKTGTQAAGYKFPEPTSTSVEYTSFNIDLSNNGKPRSYIYNFGPFTTQTPGSVTITKYEAEFGRIEGTFEGTLVDIDEDNQYEEISVKITNGHFWFIRDEDNPF